MRLQISLSPGHAQDVLLFADACFLNSEFHRAIHAIKSANLVEIDNVHAIRRTTLEAHLLLGQCMVRAVVSDNVALLVDPLEASRV